MTTLFGKLDKIAMDRMRQFEPPEGYWLAFSGGKDSVVLLDLAERSGVKFRAHYSVISIDPPELIRFIKRGFSDTGRVTMDTPPRPFFAEMMVSGYPTRTHRWCCGKMKHKTPRGAFRLDGVRWAESIARRGRPWVDGCPDSAIRFLRPIIEWSAHDIWEYIHRRSLATCELYREGFTRLGCVGCPGSESQRWYTRWPRLYARWRRAFHDLFELRRQRGKSDWPAKWSSADVLFETWLDRRAPLHGDLSDNGCGLFGSGGTE